MFKYITGILGVTGVLLGMIAYSLYKKDISNNIAIDKLSDNVTVLTDDLKRCHDLRDNQVDGCFDYIEGKNKLEDKYSNLIIEYNKAVSKIEDIVNVEQNEVGTGNKPIHIENVEYDAIDSRVAAAKRLLCSANLAEQHLCESTN